MIFENLRGVNISEKIIIFLILLIPIVLIFGPAIPNILRFLIIIIGCTILLNKINLKSFNNWYFFLFLLFCCYISIRSLTIFFEDGATIENVLFSLKSSLFYFSYLIYSLVIAFTINKFEFIRLYISIIIFTIISLLLIDSIFQSLFLYNLLGMPIMSLGRASSLFGDELILGSYTVKLLPIAMLMSYYLFKEKTFNNIYFSFVLIGTSLIVLSGERSSFLLWILFNFLFLFYIKIRIRYLLILLFVFITTITSVSMFKKIDILGGIYYRYVIELKYALTFKQSQKFKFFSRGHANHAEIAIKMAKDNILFGQGPNMFRKKCSKPDFFVKDGCTTHPHNIYLQLFAETGLVGAAYFTVLFTFLSWVYLRHIFKVVFNNKKSEINEQSNQFQLMLIPIYLFLWPAITSGNFFNSWINNIYFLCLGIALSYIISSKEKNNEKRIYLVRE